MSVTHELLDYRGCNRRLINLYWIFSAVVLVIEIIIAVYYYDKATMTIMSWPLYIYVRDIIILPCTLMLLITAICKTIVSRFQENHKNFQPYVITFTCAALSTLLIIIHHGLNVIFATCVIPIIFSLAYDDKKVLFYTFIFCFFCFVGTFIYLSYFNFPIKLDFAEAITNIAIIIAVYLVCKIILNRYREIIKIMSETARHNVDLLDKVHYDGLTGIYNRRYMEEALERIVKSSARSKSLLSLIMVDVDFFKEYNDTYGHSMGDKCLKTIAETLSSSLSRADDFVARYGGEEFLVVLPNTDQDGARVIADRLLESIIECNIPHEKSSVADCITISAGITTGRAECGYSAHDYIKSADKALYESKQNGRNKFTARRPEAKTADCLRTEGVPYI